MLTYIKDEICYIPVDFNIFFSLVNKCRYKIKYTGEYRITESVFNDLNTFIMNSEFEYYILDFLHVVPGSSRGFKAFEKKINNIIISNVTSSTLRTMIEEDLEISGWTGNSKYPQDMMYDNKIIEEHINNCRKLKDAEIINKVINGEKEFFLPSSGLYSNYYVDVKQLFLHVEDFQYIIFRLAEIITEKCDVEKIDAFVSSSKNGAIIANILAGLLDVKEVHLIGVGPKYAMEMGDSIEYIRKGKKYAYIYDFMCTGTEAKIVSALINSRKAYLKCAIGVARYEHCNFLPQNTLVKHLLNTEELGIKYKISGEKEN